MDLEHFIRDVLKGVMAGIAGVDSDAKQLRAIVNPPRFQEACEDYQIGDKPKLERVAQIHNIDFDVAVTVESADCSDAGARIAVMGVGVGGKLEATNKNSSVSRVKFSLPVILPSAGV
jgi:hypothetical protein